MATLFFSMYTAYRALRQTSVALYTGGHWRQPSLFVRLWINGLLNFRTVSHIYTRSGFGDVSKIIAEEPHLLGVLVWPLVDARWEPQRRLHELMRHYREAAVIGNLLELKPQEIRTLLPLDHITPTLQVCLERQPWFAREGQLAMSVFYGGTRVFSVAFLLSQVRGRRAVYIGAVQGVKQAPDDSTYKLITKAAHGLRPRDLAIEMFLLFCESMHVDHVLAVRDKNRQHQHTYFGDSGKSEVFANYDAIWAENNAHLGSGDFYSLQPGLREKDLSSVASKKRSMYRKRHEFLCECLGTLQHAVNTSARPQDHRQHVRTAPVPLWELQSTRIAISYMRWRRWMARLRTTIFGSWLWSCPVIFV